MIPGKVIPHLPTPKGLCATHRLRNTGLTDWDHCPPRTKLVRIEHSEIKQNKCLGVGVQSGDGSRGHQMSQAASLAKFIKKANRLEQFDFEEGT